MLLLVQEGRPGFSHPVGSSRLYSLCYPIFKGQGKQNKTNKQITDSSKKCWLFDSNNPFFKIMATTGTKNIKIIESIEVVLLVHLAIHITAK